MEDILRRHKILSLLTYILFGIIVVNLTRLPAENSPEYNMGSKPIKGFHAPDFTLQSIKGDRLHLNDLRGNVIVLNFWASWCPPCRIEMATFQKLFQQYQSQKVMILTINVTNQDSMNALQTFIDKYNLTLPILLDRDGKVSQIYQIQSLPTTFIINPNGVITDIIYGGPVSETLLKIRIQQALGQ